jgi:CRP-like cAMP-binding protein
MSNDFFSYQSSQPAAGPTTATASAPGAAPAGPPVPPQWVLQELSAEDWEHVLRFAARRRYAAGAPVLVAGQADAALHLIASGQVRLHGGAGAAAAVERLRGEGEAFGLLSFLDGAPAALNASVGSGAPADILRITPEALQQLAAWQPRLALALLRDVAALVAARLRALQPAD